MTHQPVFAPGFRISVLDGLVVLASILGAIALSMFSWWWGFVVGFVVVHFFLFCNLIRMSRALELLWAGVFVALSAATILGEFPGWVVTALVSLVVTTIVVIVELRKPSYHGIGWKTINPGLPHWWESQQQSVDPIGSCNPPKTR